MRVLDEDIVRVFGERYDRFTRETKKNRVIKVLFWGDEVDLVDPSEADDPTVKDVRVRVYNPGLGADQIGVIRKKSASGRSRPKRYRPIRWRTNTPRHLLEVTFIDVQQGDATLVRTPDRKTILIDGGEGKFVARLLAAIFPHTTAAKPLVLDALVVTHGDADHFSGLVELAEAHRKKEPRKNIHARVARYYHNGLVKAGGKIVENGHERNRREKEKLGDHVVRDGKTYVTAIYNDPRDARERNEPFEKWNTALETLLQHRGLGRAERLRGERLPRIERIEFGQDSKFDIFRKGGIDIKVLGPIVDMIDGRPMLEFLRGEDGGMSASHTINGHSVVLKLTYNNVNFMLGGDLNTHAEERLRERVEALEGLDLRAEVLKVPHHGSHEFDPLFLGDVKPVISIVSSGDENAMKEYVHPRANLMAALGRYSRGPGPLVFSTELAAFFCYRGPLQPEQHKRDRQDELVDLPKSMRRGLIHAFQRLIFGAVRVRTDGERLMAAVESANDGVKEAYAFRIDARGEVTQDTISML